jgi:hypothetical protein
MTKIQRRSRQNLITKFSTITILVLILGMGCLCTPIGFLQNRWTPTYTPKQTPAQIETKIPVHVVPTETSAPVNIPVTVPLNATGPWLLVETDSGLWATNHNGSGLKKLTDIDYWDYRLPAALQPHGNLIAFISPAGSDLHHMSLNLLSLPEGTITKITDLTSAETEAYADLAPGEAGLEALLAVRERHNLAWSTDGQRLAFVGVMDGPTAEIYVYDIVLNKIQRISSDDAQNYSPSWSPDGKTLLYFGTDSFSSGAVLSTNGVWEASGEGMNPSWLYTPEKDSGAEHLVGWMDDTTAVLDNIYPASGPERLRLYNVVTTKEVMLNENWMLAAEADSWRFAVIYADPSGLFLLTSLDETPVHLSQQEVEWIPPVNPGEYFFKVYFTDGSLATYGTSEYDHAVSPTNVMMGTGGQDVSVWGWIWLWTSDAETEPGAWVTGPGADVGRIFDDRAAFPMWDQDSNLFFFGVEGVNAFRLYHATFDAFYSDLMEVGFINAAVRSVGWLGNP